MNHFNRPSVIVFNVENDLNRNSVIVSNEQLVNNFDENSTDSVIVLGQNEQLNSETISRDNSLISEIENSVDSFDNYFDNDNNLDNDSVRPPNRNLSEEQYLNIIRDNYDMSSERNQFSKLYGVLFSHFKTKINPHIYEELQPDNFMDLFRDIFQDIFNRVLEKIEAEFPNKFSRVKVNLKANDLNINLQFLPLTDISSELFLIELYRLLQSKKDIVTSSEIELSFTFLPKN